MTDRELEQRLRAWYRDGVGDDETAPFELRERVAAIPVPAPTPLRPLGGRRGFTLLAAAAILVVGGALAAGSGLLRLSPIEPPTPPDALVTTVEPSDASDPTDPAETPVATVAPVVRSGDLIAFIRSVEKDTGCSRPPCNYARIWIAKADGTDARELFPGVATQQELMGWTTDGSRLLYADAGGIFLVDPAGGQPEHVDTGCAPVSNSAPLSCQRDSQVAFSRDGRHIVFVRESTDADGYWGPSILATMDLESGLVTELTSTSSGGVMRPGWSADGTRIVFWRYGFKDDGGFLPPIADAVFVVHTDGTNLRAISPADLDARDAHWSPDGARILFLSPSARQPANVDSFTAYGDLYTMRPDGSDTRRLTDDGLAANPAWTPDGRIVYVRASAGDSGEAGWWTMDADGGNASMLVPAATLGLNAFDLGQARPILQPLGGAAIVPLPWTPAVPIAVGPPAPTPAPTPIPDLAAGFSWTGEPTIADESPLGQTATLLLDGRVLATEGCGTGAELYDPTTGTFSPTGSLTATRGGKTATLLRDGRVLVTGGYNCGPGGEDGLWATAEIYDPTTGTFSRTGSMRAAREYHTATLLDDGRVLIAGGLSGPALKVAGEVTLASVQTADTTTALASAEIYDPATGTFSKAGSMGTGRLRHTATLLRNGRVLVTGAGAEGLANSTSAELYDPATDRWSPTGSMAKGRSSHTATLLGDGRVLILGGASAGDAISRNAEIYDPGSGTFRPAGSMDDRRDGHTATLLPDGRVLIAGGWWSNGSRYRVLSSAELYDPAAETFTPIGSMGTPRNGHTATLLDDGRVLITGGSDLGYEGGVGVTSAVLYQP